jgi:hypothetical protein
MTREPEFWILIAFLAASAFVLGWLRARVINRAFRAIDAELRNRHVELSRYELQLLLGQLSWNQNAVIESEAREELRVVKEPHVRSLVRFLRLIRNCLWILVGAGLVALFLFQWCWPDI